MSKKFKVSRAKAKDNKAFVDIRTRYAEDLKSGAFTLSFAYFDREHELFNLGSQNGPVKAEWFIELLDRLKAFSNSTVQELKTSNFDFHPVNWKSANTKPPKDMEQCEFYQFRINKSKGRVIGVLENGVFYIIWLDPHHNLTDSEGYGKARKYKAPK
ncbi:hypothetical protein IJT93_09745 [bacterium]|nr:hypothetical protein [bacterium]